MSCSVSARQAWHSVIAKGGFRASNRKRRSTGLGRQRQFDVVSSGRSTGLWHRQGSSGCFRDFDPASGRRPMSAVPRKPDGGDAIFLLSVRPVVAGTGFPLGLPQADLGRQGHLAESQVPGAAVYSHWRPSADVGDRQVSGISLLRHRAGCKREVDTQRGPIQVP